MKLNVKKIFLSILLFLTFWVFVPKVLAQDSCDSTCSPTDSACWTKLTDLCQQKVNQLHDQANTLSDQIAQFNAQIKLTTVKIAQTEAQISLLAGRLDQLSQSVASLTAAFSSRAVETYKLSRFEDNFFFILSATDISDAFSRFHYLEKIQQEDQNLLGQLQDAQTLYQSQKASQEDLQKTLKIQQANLNSQKVAKANLLAATQNDEKKYQQLLSQARAQLAALSNFATSRGGGIIPHQDLSDSWGKYFNQRDANWGNNLIGLSSYPIWQVGCLITSYAMVVTHYGGNITPADVAADAGNFFSNTALFNSPGPSANGHSAQSLDNPSMDDLRSRLNAGAVIIAGLSMDGGPYPQHYSDHWVVLRSVDGDSFKINDPWYPGAMNVSLSDHYSGWTIIQARVYN
jgi:peptidoglycan hydrolase CwlO-like protein